MSRWPSNPPPNSLRRKLFFAALLVAVWLLCSGDAWAGPLSDRLDRFPDWQSKPSLQEAQGDLAYPDWMAGTWQLRTVLVDMAAPLAPEVTTPGYDGNRRYLNQPVECVVKFVAAAPLRSRRFLPELMAQKTQVISDHAYNGMSLAKAYLGEGAVKAVKVDPDNPNRQVTLLRGDRQLESTVTGRATEWINQAADPQTFITSEVFQQVFRGTAQPFFNEVENTTAYTWSEEKRNIIGEQVTAIYLSPRDPDYFKAINRPVALYRYRLTLTPN